MRRLSLIVAPLLLAAVTGAILLGYGAARSTSPPAAPVPGPSGSAGGYPGAASPATEPLPGSLRAETLRIPALAVTARITASSVFDGVLTPPRVPTEVGLWAGSAPLTATGGEVTIAGHVNWAGMAPFAFGRLAELHPGDLIYTTDARGVRTSWRVSHVATRAKTRSIDPAAFAGVTGPRRLALITCGGAFDRGADSYRDNVYVYADPA